MYNINQLYDEDKLKYDVEKYKHKLLNDIINNKFNESIIPIVIEKTDIITEDNKKSEIKNYEELLDKYKMNRT